MPRYGSKLGIITHDWSAVAARAVKHVTMHGGVVTCLGRRDEAREVSVVNVLIRRDVIDVFRLDVECEALDDT